MIKWIENLEVHVIFECQVDYVGALKTVYLDLTFLDNTLTAADLNSKLLFFP